MKREKCIHRGAIIFNFQSSCQRVKCKRACNFSARAAELKTMFNFQLILWFTQIFEYQLHLPTGQSPRGTLVSHLFESRQ